MATTTNYGWDTPDDTDLVKDGAAAIRTLGSSVDTTTKALNPSTTLGDIEYRSATANTNTRLPIGTNGQVLGVSGGVPAWVTDAAGMTNPMTTTGDTIYSSSGSTPARLAIGSTGNVLTVAGGVPTWAAPAATTPTFKGVRLVNSGSQLIANSTTTAVTWDTERIDTNAFHSTSSNTSRITIPSGLGGYYDVFGSFIIKKGAATSVEIFLYKNGSSIGNAIVSVPSTTVNFTQLYYTAYLSLAATDYIELYARQNAGEDRPLMGNNEFLDGMYFQASLIGV
jgi:hypothetical protein